MSELLKKRQEMLDDLGEEEEEEEDLNKNNRLDKFGAESEV